MENRPVCRKKWVRRRKVTPPRLSAMKPGETQAWGDIQVKKYRRPGFAGRAGGAGRNSRQAAQPDRPSRRRPEVVRRFSADLRNRTGRLARPLRDRKSTRLN